MLLDKKREMCIHTMNMNTRRFIWNPGYAFHSEPEDITFDLKCKTQFSIITRTNLSLKGSFTLSVKNRVSFQGGKWVKFLFWISKAIPWKKIKIKCIEIKIFFFEKISVPTITWKGKGNIVNNNDMSGHQQRYEWSLLSFNNFETLSTNNF